MKENIKKLLENEKISNYKISKETGIAQSTISNYATGKSDIGNMKLDHAEILNNYYLREMANMINVKRTKVLTDSTLKFFALPKFKEDFKKHFKEEDIIEELMIIDEDFYKTLLWHPVVTDERFIHNFTEGALEGITPYKYKHISTMNNIHEHEIVLEIAGSETADFRVSERLAEPYRI